MSIKNKNSKELFLTGGLVYSFIKENKTKKLKQVSNIILKMMSVSESDVFLNSEILELLDMNIQEIKDYLGVRVIQNCQYYDYSKQEWLGVRGFWIVNRKV